MDTITGMMAVLAALAMAVERVVEIIKNLIPFLATRVENNAILENRRKAMLQAISVAMGTAIAYVGYSELNAYLPAIFNASGESSFSKVWQSAVLGLMASGGSGFWNHGLGIVEEIKKASKITVANLPKKE